MAADKRNVEFVMTATDKASSVFKTVGAKLSSGLKESGNIVGGAVSSAIGNTVANGVGAAIDFGVQLLKDGFKVKADKDMGAFQIEIGMGKTKLELEQIQTVLDGIFNKGYVNDYTQLTAITDLVDGKIAGAIKNNDDLDRVIKGSLAAEKAYGTDRAEVIDQIRVGTDTFKEEVQKSMDIAIEGIYLIGDDKGNLADAVNNSVSAAKRLAIGHEDLYNRIFAFTQQGGQDVGLTGKALNQLVDFFDTGGEAAENFYKHIRTVLKQPTRNFAKEWAEGTPEMKKKMLEDIGGAIGQIQDKTLKYDLTKQMFGGVTAKEGEALLAYIGPVNDAMEVGRERVDKLITSFENLDSIKMQGIKNELDSVVAKEIFTTENMKAFSDFVKENTPVIIESIKLIGGAIKDVAEAIVAAHDGYKLFVGIKESDAGQKPFLGNQALRGAESLPWYMQPINFLSNVKTDIGQTVFGGGEGRLAAAGRVIQNPMLSVGGFGQMAASAVNNYIFNGNNLVDKKGLYDFTKQADQANKQFSQK